MVSAKKQSRRETLTIRIRPEDRGLIDQGAKVRGKSRTEFIIDAARQAAEEAVLDRSLILVSPEAYEEFLARLDSPPQPNERLKQSMQTPAPWECNDH